MSNNFSRRNFLKTCCQTGGALSASIFLQPLIPLTARVKVDVEPADLVVVQGNPGQSVAKVFELLGGISKFAQPNASFPNPPTWGSTTNPEVVKAVAKLVLQAGAKRVIVADNTMSNGERCFKRTGLKAALEKLENVKLIPLQRESYFTE